MESKFLSYIKSHGWQLVRFIIVGLATFALNIFLVWLFYGKARIDYRLAATYAYFITVVVHFILNRSFTYRHEGKLLSSDIVKYCLMLFSNYVITLSVTTVTVELFLLTPYHGTIFSTFITAFSSFLLMKYFVFSGRYCSVRYLKIVLLMLCTLVIAGLLSYKDYLQDNQLYFLIDIQAPQGGTSQIFFDIGGGYNELDSRKALVKFGDFSEYSFSLPSLPIKAIRFDPLNAAQITSVISIKNARIENGMGETLKTFPIQAFKAQRQISRMDTSGDVLVIHPVENAYDPITEIQNSSFEMKVSFVTYFIKHGWLLYASYVFFSFLFLVGLTNQVGLKSIAPPKRLVTFPIVAILFAFAILSAFQLFLLKTVPHSSGEDLARHVALALNFHDALLHGQLIPRLQLAGDPPDMVVFQYYGVLSSLFAQPGLFFGFAPLDSLVMGVVIIRWLAAMAIYTTCRIQNLSQQASIVAVIAWLSFPYIQSNLYGRVAFSETFAQAVLTFIPLSWALVARYSKHIAALTVMLTIFLLAIAHAIFLMWGAFVIVVMVIASFVFNRRDSAEVLLVGLILGICISSFQWLPALLSHTDLGISFLADNPFYSAHYTSFSGFTGWPVSFKDAIEGAVEYYFDVSMWIIPSVIAAIAYFIKEKKSRVDIIINITFLLIFIFIAYSPIDFWQFLPKSTWATQFPYRLLSFVAIFGAIVLAYACDSWGLRDHWIKTTLVALLILLCSGKSLIAPAILNADGFSPNKNIATDYASRFYLIFDKNIIDIDGVLIQNNFISVPVEKLDKYLYLEAKSVALTGEGINVNLTNAATKDSVVFVQHLHIPVSGIKIKVHIPDGVSSVSLVPDSSSEFSIIDFVNHSHERLLPILISRLDIGSAGIFPVSSSDVNRTITSPYQRSFSFPLANNFVQASQYAVSLPLAYSRFQKISQGTRILMSKPTFNGLTQVVITDLKVPIISSYELPLAVSYFTIAGFLLLIAYIWFSQQGFRRASE